MISVNNTECCGFKEIDGLEGTETEQALKEVCNQFFNQSDAAFLFFTGVSKERYGQKFKALIKKEKLGEIIETKAKRNPNSGRIIKAWVWTIDRPKFRDFAYKNNILID